MKRQARKRGRQAMTEIEALAADLVDELYGMPSMSRAEAIEHVTGVLTALAKFHAKRIVPPAGDFADAAMDEARRRYPGTAHAAIAPSKRLGFVDGAIWAAGGGPGAKPQEIGQAGPDEIYGVAPGANAQMFILKGKQAIAVVYRDPQTGEIGQRVRAHLIAASMNAFHGTGSVLGGAKSPPGILWECKDYADGWISFTSPDEAKRYQDETGCLVRVTYRAPPPATSDGAEA